MRNVQSQPPLNLTQKLGSVLMQIQSYLVIRMFSSQQKCGQVCAGYFIRW